MYISDEMINDAIANASTLSEKAKSFAAKIPIFCKIENRCACDPVHFIESQMPSCFSLSGTRLWARLKGNVIVPIGSLVLAYLNFVGMCVGCYYIALENGHLQMYGGGLPPISALGGNFPEQGLFIACWFITCILLFVCLFFRSAMIDETLQRHPVHTTLFVLGMFGLPNLMVMACVSMYTPWPPGVFHLLCAGTGCG